MNFLIFLLHYISWQQISTFSVFLSLCQVCEKMRQKNLFDLYRHNPIWGNVCMVTLSNLCTMKHYHICIFYDATWKFRPWTICRSHYLIDFDKLHGRKLNFNKTLKDFSNTSLKVRWMSLQWLGFPTLWRNQSITNSLNQLDQVYIIFEMKLKKYRVNKINKSRHCLQLILFFF